MYAFYCWSTDGITAWDFTRNVVTANITLKAYYSTKNVYTVSLDGNAKNYEEGARVEKPADPVKEATAEYTYTFVGWYYLKDGSLTLWNFATDTVTSDVALVSEFASAKVRYTVSIYSDGADGVMLTKILEWGETIPYPELHEKEWYEFLGWVDEDGHAAASVMPTENISVYADWKMSEYTVDVTCSNGLSHTEAYTLATAETALQNLEKFLLQANSEQYTYAWETELPQSLLAKNYSFNAIATKVRYKLTVITDPFNEEATTKEQILAWGEEIVIESPPGLRGRNFLGWTTAGENVPLVMPTKNITVYGVWEWIEYTLTVVDCDGVESKVTYTVKEADDPLYVQALFASFLLPENTNAYTYAWSAPLPQTLPLESGKTYAMEKTAIEYTITFANVTGYAPIVFTVETLSRITLPDVPGKIGYAAKWDKTLAEIGLENTTVTAVYTPIEYTITFANAEDVEDIIFTVETMQSVRLPAVPEKRGYTGKWDKKLSEIGLENVTVTALYDAIVYTVTFVGAESVAPISFTIETLSHITFPKVPERAGYAGVWDKFPTDLALENTTVTAMYTVMEYTLTFVGIEGIEPIKFTVETLDSIVFPTLPAREGYTAAWDKKISEIGLENTTVTAVYTAIEYKITFVNADGVSAILFTVETLPYLMFPKVPERAGYTGEWDKLLSELTLENTTVTAVYTAIEYVVTFANADGTPAVTFTVETKDTLVFPEPPDRIGYTSAWDKQPSELVAENTTVTAVYTPITYTIDFANAEGVESIVFTVENMSALHLPAIPEKAGYTGKWDKNLSNLGLRNETVTAIYTPIEYRITFVGVKGVEPIAFTVETMNHIVFPAVPEKAGYAGEWDKTSSDIGLGDLTVKAIYTMIAYTITFEGTEGVEPLTFTVETLSDVKLPETPSKLGYTAGWDKSVSEIGLENTVVTAIYTPIEYTLTFANAEEVAAIVFTVETLASIQLPVVPQKVGYLGTWNKDLSEIGLENVTLTAVYTPIEYTVIFAGVEGVEPIQFTVETISKINLPEVPKKEGYTGVWNKTAADIKLENTVVTAIYTEIPAMDQVKDYGEQLASSCFGSVSASGILFPLGVALIVLSKKKEY